MSEEVIPYLGQLPLPSHSLFLQKLEAQLAKDLYPIDWGELTAEPTPVGIVNRLNEVVLRLIQEMVEYVCVKLSRKSQSQLLKKH